MPDQIDECFALYRQGYTLTLVYRVAGHTVRVEIRRDAYREQSWAVADVLTPALTWTRLASHPPSLWWQDTPGPSTGTPAVLHPVAATVLRRALALLDTTTCPLPPPADPWPAQPATDR